MNPFALAYFGSWLLALLITPVVIKCARRLKVVDCPGVRKIHSVPIFRIGGVAVFLSVMLPSVSLILLSRRVCGDFFELSGELIAVFAMGAFMFFVGLVDDIKGLRARVKLICQFAAAAVVCSAGVKINSITFSDTFALNLGSLAWPSALLWIVGVTNAVNFIDGLDGLAAGISAIAAGVIALLALKFGQPATAVIMLCLVGALVGFLFFNFHPAGIFMGDCGSQFLGFMLAATSVMCAARSGAAVSLTLPAVVLGIPIFDTLISMLRRFLGRRSIFSADRGHFHHRLLALGLGHSQVVIVAYAVTLTATCLGMFMLFTTPLQTVVVFVCILLLLGMGFRCIGSVRLRETIEALRRKRMVANEMKQEKADFEQLQLHLAGAHTFDQWWRSLCLAAERMRFMTITLPLTDRSGTRRLLSWESDGETVQLQNLVRTTVPIRDRRSGSVLELEAAIHADGSLESAGRRITLFNRLIEENSLEKLQVNQRIHSLSVDSQAAFEVSRTVL